MRYLFLAICFLLSACGGKKHVHQIGIDPSWYPLNIPGKEARMTAFSDELLQEIAEEESLKLAKVSMSWDNLLWGLENEKPLYEAILTSMQPYVFLEKQYDFSDSYLATGPVLVVPTDSKIDNIDMLGGKEIGVLQGSSGELILETNPDILIRPYGLIPEALNDVAKGNLDGALVDLLIAEAYCHDIYNGQLKIATPPLNNAGLRLMTLHGKAEDLMEAFNEGLAELKASGKYAEIARKWEILY